MIPLYGRIWLVFWDILQDRMVRKLGNGQYIIFWLDKWILNNNALMNLSTDLIIDTTLILKGRVNKHRGMGYCLHKQIYLSEHCEPTIGYFDSQGY